ncbi:MAG TPA: hypothetical protein VJB63_00245 [Patescibacteria group bacterium]|nr:hypothetical protein [Patescibacteria group bacterium]
MKKYTIFLTYSILLVLSVFFVVPTRALTLKILPTIQQKVEDLKTQRCTTLTQNIDRRINRFNSNKERHISQYNTAKQRLTQLAAKLQQKGYDVTQLQADAKIWDSKIQKFASDYTVFINKLTETKNVACGQSDETFRTSLNQARQQVKIVYQDSTDARTYYQTVIKADIQALRDQKPTIASPQ